MNARIDGPRRQAPIAPAGPPPPVSDVAAPLKVGLAPSAASSKKAEVAPEARTAGAAGKRVTLLEDASRGLGDVLRAFPQPTDYVVKAFRDRDPKAIAIVLDGWASDRRSIGAEGAPLTHSLAWIAALKAQAGDKAAASLLTELPRALQAQIAETAVALQRIKAPSAAYVARLTELMAEPPLGVRKRINALIDETATDTHLAPEEGQELRSLLVDARHAMRLCDPHDIPDADPLWRTGSGGARDDVAWYLSSHVPLALGGIHAKLPPLVAQRLAAGALSAPADLSGLTATLAEWCDHTDLAPEALAAYVDAVCADKPVQAGRLLSFIASAEFRSRSIDDQRSFVTAFCKQDLSVFPPELAWHAMQHVARTCLSGVSATGKVSLRRMLLGITPRPFHPNVPVQTSLITYEIRAKHIHFADGSDTEVIADPDTAPHVTIEQAARALAGLPLSLRKNLTRLSLSSGTYENAAMSAAEEGVTTYQNESENDDETRRAFFLHEIGHLIAFSHLDRDLDGPTWDVWQKAMHDDALSVSGYADENAHEDFAETVVLYVQAEGTAYEPALRALYPQRFTALDAILH